MNTRDIRVACISALIVTDDASYSVGNFKIRKKKKCQNFSSRYTNFVISDRENPLFYGCLKVCPE